jgi:hypothetical protein
LDQRYFADLVATVTASAEGDVAWNECGDPMQRGPLLGDHVQLGVGTAVPLSAPIT